MILGVAIRTAAVAPAVPTIGTALITNSPAGTGPPTISPPSLVITSGSSVTITYCITGAVSAYLDKRDGSTVPLNVDGAQHTVSFTPTFSGDLPIFATDAAGGVVVSPVPFVVQDSPALPALDPTAPATKTSAQAGAWSSTFTWTGGVVPGRDDIVSVSHAVTVSGRGSLAGRLLLQSGGSVTVSGGALLVSDVHVKSGGVMTTDGRSGSGPAIVLLRNRPHHANDTAGNSPDGMANFWPAVQVDSGGALLMRAPDKTSYARATTTPVLAGATSITLQSAVAGWNVGDKLLIPDSRQYLNADFDANTAAGHPVRKYDIAVVRGVSSDGLTVYLLNPLLYDHPGAHDLDGNAITDMQPHVVNLYRNSIFVTSDPTTIATRAHVRFAGRATCDLVAGVLHGTGRTVMSQVGSSNPDGRLPLYLDGVIGPVSPLSYGDQAHVENCVILEPVPVVPEPQVVWGITVEASFYCTFKNNVCFNWLGAGIFQRDEVSSYNVYDGNFVSVVKGLGSRFSDQTGGVQTAGTVDNGFHGMGIEICSPFNKVVNNIVTSVTGGGNNLHVGIAIITPTAGAPDAVHHTLPAFQGADPAVNGVSVDCHNVPFGMSGTGTGDFDNNEIYGTTDMGLEWWYINGDNSSSGTSTVTTVLSNTRVWHHHNQLAFPYYGNHVTVSNLRCYGELANLQELSGNQGPTGIYNGDYRTQDLTFDGCHIEGLNNAWYPSTNGSGCRLSETFRATMKNSTIRCKRTLFVGDRMFSGGSYYTGFGTRITTLDNNTYVDPGHGISWSIVTLLTGDQDLACTYTAPDLVHLTNYSGSGGLPGTHNYELHWQEQLGNFVMPQSATIFKSQDVGPPAACPRAGLTVRQANARYTAIGPYTGMPRVKGRRPCPRPHRRPANGRSHRPGLTVKGSIVPYDTYTTLTGMVGTDNNPAPVVQTS